MIDQRDDHRCAQKNYSGTDVISPGRLDSVNANSRVECQDQAKKPE